MACDPRQFPAWQRLAGLLLVFVLGNEAAAAQQVTADVPADGVTSATRPIAFRASAPLAPAERRLVLFIDQTDVSALVTATADGWVYDARTLPLSSGEHELTAWLQMEDGRYEEVLRQAVRVPGALGIRSAGVKPSLDMGLNSRLASAFDPTAAGERETFNELEAQFGVETTVERYGGMRFALRSQFVGHSEQNRALRFGELADDAPRIDLSSWLAQLRTSRVELALGNVVAGNARHLIQGFGSRGASIGVTASSRVQLSAAALHGSNLVGWDDLAGLGEPDHRIVTGSLGLEALPQPGMLRVELTALDGSVLPNAGFNRGAILDAETSTGYAIRVQTQALDQRFRLEGGFARSTFDNPEEPAFGGDTVLVPVERATKNARYLQTSLDVLRGLRLGGNRTARLTLAFEHERIDPLFRTVASYTQADRLQNRWEARADIIGVSVVANHGRTRNNLDEIPSILTSLTHQTGVNVAVPLAAMFRGRDWLPQFRFGTNRTHQFGAGVPVNGEFAESHVPDQVSTVHNASVDLRLGPGSLSYRYDRSLQDNRQPGREQADLARAAHAITVQASALRVLSITGEVSWANALNRERDETDHTRRYALGISWMPLREAVLVLQFADTRNENIALATSGTDRNWSLQWSSPVPWLNRLGGRTMLRFARAENSQAQATGNSLRRSSWMMDAGLNFSLR